MEGSSCQPGPGVVTKMAAGSHMGNPTAAAEVCASGSRCHKSGFLVSHSRDRPWSEPVLVGVVAGFGYR